jgi:phosphoribosyl-ATP pyrophosphohydrolase/phosphoribosyl-AMP cyclohydrolase
MQPPIFDDKGLVPCVVQDAHTGVVLMVAFMNAESFALTVDSGVVHFWSRSRQALWKKGETSGNLLHVVELRVDCDRDAVLVRARPDGPTCHTGTTSCFFRVREGDGERQDDGVPAATVSVTPEASDGRILDALAEIIAARKRSTAEKSYTKSLLDGGPAKIIAKIVEESGELCEELPSGPADAVAHETADLLFHVLVGLGARDVPLEAVWQTLRKRLGTSGHVEKAGRGQPA